MQTILPSRESARPHPRPDWFSGAVYNHALTDGKEATHVEILAVRFDAGSRTRPHTHSTEQLLYFLEGVGVVADRTDRRRYIYPAAWR